MKLIDITGQRFGRTVAIKKMPPRPSKSGGSDWLCLCDCGKEHIAIGSNLRKGHTTSCGCAALEWASYMGSNRSFINIRSKSITKHGNKRRNAVTVEYKTWLAMKRRCYDAKYHDFPNWGGRGIAVCDRWRNSFENFLADMGKRPSGPYSIDRIDPNQDYKPENCRWATLHEQASENKRNLIPVSVNGISFNSLKAACKHFCVPYTRVHLRLKNGQTLESAIFTPAYSLPNVRPKSSYLPKSKR